MRCMSRHISTKLSKVPESRRIWGNTKNPFRRSWCSSFLRGDFKVCSWAGWLGMKLSLLWCFLHIPLFDHREIEKCTFFGGMWSPHQLQQTLSHIHTHNHWHYSSSMRNPGLSFSHTVYSLCLTGTCIMLFLTLNVARSTINTVWILLSTDQ